MNLLKKFSNDFLDEVINRYKVIKDGNEVTHDDINLESVNKKKKILHNILLHFRSKLEEVPTNSITSYTEIIELIEEDSAIDRYLTTSLEEETKIEFEKTLHNDDGEKETRYNLDEENLDNATLKYNLLEDEFKDNIITLDDLVQNNQI